MMLNVIIIDQRPIVRMGLKYCLETNYKESESNAFATVQDATQSSLPESPDLILLGIDMELEKAGSLYELKKVYAKSRVIVYDSEVKAETAMRYLKSGAHGYFSKKSDLTLMLNCIDQVLDGKFYIDPRHMDTFLNGMVSAKSPTLNHTGSRTRNLTPRQSEIAVLLAQGVSTSGIARKLNLQSSTVSTVKAIIYEKLKVSSIIDLSKLVLPNE